MFLIVGWVAVSLTVSAHDEVRGKVVSVIDGNTVEVALSGNQKEKIVLKDIDCPELGQEFGESAKKLLEKLVLQKNVIVKFQGKDRWGNYLGIVMIDDNDPRVTLLKEGLAWTSEKNPDPDLELYRTWAQQKGRGLWRQDKPTPPWVYRRQQTMVRPKSS